MDQSITHTLARGQQEGTAGASPQGRPVERAVRPPAVASPPPIEPAAPPEALLRAIDKKPGQRLLARGFDLLLFTILFETALMYVWPQIREGRLLLLALMPGFLLYLLLDAMFMTWFGVTPGKSLLRIRVVPAAGGRIGWRSALKRSFRVGWTGFAMGLPGVNLVTLQTSRKRLLANGRTAWDQQGNFYVLHGRIGVMRTLAFIVCSLFLVMAGSIIRLLGQERSPGILATASHEADVAPPVQVEPTPPALAGALPVPAMGEREQQGTDDANAVQLVEGNSSTTGVTGSHTTTAPRGAVTPAVKDVVHAQRAGKHAIHHTLHPSVLLAAQSGASHHAAHPKKSHAPNAAHSRHTSIAARSRPEQHAQHAMATTGLAADADRPAVSDKRPTSESTASEPSNDVAGSNQAVHQRVSTIQQGAAGSGTDMPVQPAQEQATAWQPITASQALDTDTEASGASNVTASTGVASQAGYPETGDRVAQTPAERAAPAAGDGVAPAAGDSHRPGLANDAGTEPGHRQTGAAWQPAALTDGIPSAGTVHQVQPDPMPAAVPDAGQAGSSAVGVPVGAQFSANPISVTPQVR